MKNPFSYFSCTLFFFLFSFLCPLHAQVITTVAGNGTFGYIDGVPATSGEIRNPAYIAIDNLGNLYITDQGNQRIRMVDTSGMITTVAGNGIYGFSGDSGPATLAELQHPYGVAADAAGNIYIADEINYRLRKVSPAIGGAINTVAGTGAIGFSGDGGPATIATFNDISGVVIDHAGDLILADGNNRIRKISPATGGIVTTIAGNGGGSYTGDGVPATTAGLASPHDVAVDGIGNVFIADFDDNRVRKVDTFGMISTIAGNGTPGYSSDGIAATASEIYNPTGVDVDACGNVYIADEANNRIRKVDINGIITTIAGNGTAAYGGDGGPATAGILWDPFDVKVDRKGNIFIADAGNSRIRKISSANRAPYFTAGHIQGLIVCSDSSSVINALLAVIDSDMNQGETWSVLSAPVHGTLVAVYVTISTGGTLTPAGLSYIPGGYIGSDSFTVVISDCAELSDTTTVYVTAKACPLSVLNAANRAGSLEIYPNPNSGTFSLYVSSASTGEAHIVISNMMGEKVKEITTATNTMTDIQLIVPEGIYFCNVITKDGNYMKKVLILK